MIGAVLILVVFAVSVFSVVVVLLGFVYPAAYGLPLVATGPERIRKALKLANLRPDEVIYDLGAGDGRVLLMAAREFGARAVGIEIGPVQAARSSLRVTASGFGERIQVRCANFYKVGLQPADVVFVYATSREALKLAPYLEQQMKKGSRLVSVSADFPGWEPSAMDERDLIFVYNMPPTTGSVASYLLKEAK